MIENQRPSVKPRDEPDLQDLGIHPGFSPRGDISIQPKLGYTSDTYVQTMLQRFEPSGFDSLVEMLPEDMRGGVVLAYRQFEKSSRKEDMLSLGNNIQYYLEFTDLEKDLEKKERQVVESFGKTLSVDADIRAWAEDHYLGTQDYREKFKQVVESDEALYSRLKEVNSKFGFNSNDVPAAIGVIETNLLMCPASPYREKELIKEVLKDGMVLQTGEFPTIKKREIPILVPTEKEKEWHPGLKKLIAIGAGISTITVAAGAMIHGQVAHDDTLYHFKQGIRGIGDMFSGDSSPSPGQNSSQPNPEPPVLDDYNQWKIEHFGSLYSRESGYARDPDGDYVDNFIEYENGTDPLKPCTFKGLSDFDLLYTYPHYFTNLSDRNLTQKQINEFLNKIPDVEPRYWSNIDGSAVNTYKDGKYINISLRDPLFKYYADRAHIEWSDDEEYGKIGELKLGDEPLSLEYGRYDYNKSLVPPVFYLSNGRKGTCGEVATAHTAVLLFKGYKCTTCSADATPDNGEDRIDHGFLESFIDGKIYIVNFNNVVPREDKRGISTYEKWGWNLSKTYDPKWLENENFNYM